MEPVDESYSKKIELSEFEADLRYYIDIGMFDRYDGPVLIDGSLIELVIGRKWQNYISVCFKNAEEITTLIDELTDLRDKYVADHEYFLNKFNKESSDDN